VEVQSLILRVEMVAHVVVIQMVQVLLQTLEMVVVVLVLL